MLSLPNLHPFGGAIEQPHGALTLKPEADSLIESRLKKGARRLAALDAVLEGNQSICISVTEKRGILGRRKNETFSMAITRRPDNSIEFTIKDESRPIIVKLSPTGTVREIYSFGQSLILFSFCDDGRLIGLRIGDWRIGAKRGVFLGILAIYLENQLDELVRTSHERGQVVSRIPSVTPTEANRPEEDDCPEEYCVDGHLGVSADFQLLIDPTMERLERKGFAAIGDGIFKKESVAGQVSGFIANSDRTDEGWCTAVITCDQRTVHLKFPTKVGLREGDQVTFQGLSGCPIDWSYLSIFAILDDQETYETELKNRIDFADIEPELFGALVISRDGIELFRQEEVLASLEYDNFYRYLESATAIHQSWTDFREKIRIE